MKKLFLVFTVLTLIVISASAQKSSYGATTFSIGAEGSFPTGTFYDNYYRFGIGGSLQAEHRVSSNLDLVVNAGYISYPNKISGTSSAQFHYSIIPLLAGIKYWFSSKVYAQGLLGAGFTTLKLPSANFSHTSFTYTPGIGFMLTKNIDVTLKYMGISNSIAFFDNNGNFIANQAAGTFGLRLAYNFGGK